jgi:hypothetical protein
MKKSALVLVSLTLVLLLQHHAAAAGKGASASRGGSSASSSSRSSSSSAGRTYSSGAKSYSSGGSSYSSPAGKSYSSGGSSSTAVVGKTATTSGSFTAPSGKTYSSGAGSSSSTVGRTSTPSSPVPKSSYAGSTSTRPATPVTAARAAATPRPPVAYDALPAAEQKKAESRKAYVAAQKPRQTYTTPEGTPKPIDPKDRQITELRNQLNQERWVNHQSRAQVFYTTYYTRPVVYYNDPYNSFFWWWLLDRSLDDRAYWAYHHRYDMDDARYQALLAHDAALQARITQLDMQKLPRESTYVPPGLQDNPDLMYTDDYVNAAYNPQPAPVVVPPVTYQGTGYSGTYQGTSYSGAGSSGGSAFGQVLFTIFLIALIGGFIWLAVWLVFCKRWNI